MMGISRRLWAAVIAAVVALSAGIGSARAQSLATTSQPVPLITQPVDDAKLTALKGNVQMFAKPQFDRGAVDDATPTGRLVLVLKRSAAQESALRDFLGKVNEPGSPQYHHWLTPEQFGQQFGPAESDIAATTAWLQSKGLKVESISKGKTGIVFSSTAGQIREAFRTELHTFVVNGVTHHANASDPQIPAALAPVVAGIARLNDFKPQPLLKNLGEVKYNKSSHTATPSWTTPSGEGGYYLAVAPEDFRTEYDLAPLYAAGVTGSGQRIGIINDSNIDLNVVAAYRKFFLLDGSSTTPNLPTVIVDGTDPGQNGDDAEAYLDVELAGAVAPQANIDLYTAAGTDFSDGLDLAMLRAVNDDTDPVLSLSFGQCEAGIGAAGMAYYNGLWQEAAAQGQTVMVATGDSSSAVCDSDSNSVAYYGLQVNGLASTPWDIAVGGTDFYYSDYKTGGKSVGSLWNENNDAQHGSLIARIPEQAWNDSVYGLNLAPGEGISGGGGGQSSCAVPGAGTNPITSTGVADCSQLAGFPKPAWQSGSGVPNDGVRDLPDVALFSGSGYNYSFLAICVSPGDCADTSPDTGDYIFYGVGGTSAATPAFAGMMALVNQKYGPQGQANTVLYALAAQKPATFFDVTEGSNNVPCDPTADPSLDCSQDANGGGYSLQHWYTTPGYDLATGLGSVDATALVNNWNTVSFTATKTTLSATPVSITHGQSVTLSVQTAASTGSATPTGAVSFTTDSPLPNSKSISTVALDGTGAGSTSVNYLPGGTYNVYARYGGDTSFSASESAPVSIVVAPEKATLTVVASQTVYYPVPAETQVASGSTVTYGSYLAFNVQVVGAASASNTLDGVATGSIAVLDNGTEIAEVPLNATGAIYLPITTLPLGNHSLTFSYGGDPSFESVTSAPFTLTIGKGNTYIDYTVVSAPFVGNTSYEIPVEVGGANQINFGGGLAPAGTITVTLGPQSQTLPLLQNTNGTGTATAVFTNMPPANYTLYLSYSGDSNWAPASEVGETSTTFTPPAALSSTATLTMTSPTASSTPFAPGTLITMNATVTGSGTAAPTGDFLVLINGVFIGELFELTPAASGPTSSGTAIFPAYEGYSGANQVSFWYLGDGNYSSSISNVVSYTANVDDFTLNTNLATVTVKSGETANLNVLLNSYSTSTDSVSLTCTVTGGPTGNTLLPQCNLPASAALSGTGQITAKATIVTALPVSTSAKATPHGELWPLAGGPALAVLLFLVPRRRRLWRMLGAFLIAVSIASAISGCGGSSKSTTTTPPPPATQNVPAGEYSLLITATNGATAHSVPVKVVVQ